MSYDVKVRIGADTSELASGISNAVEHVKKMGTTVETAASDTKKLDDALTRYMSRLDPAYRSQVLLNQGVGLLDENLKAGNISAETHAAMLARVEAAYGTAATAAQKNGTAVAGVGKSHGMQVWRIQAFTHSIRASADQLMAGQNPAQVLGMQISQLAMTTTGTSFKLFGLAAAVLAVVGGLALAIARTEGAKREMSALEVALQATGRAGLFNAESLGEVIRQLSRLPGVGRSAATEIVASFVRTRQIGGSLFGELASIVADFARATGTEVPEAARTLAQAFAEPEAGAKRLDKELDFLSASQLLAIERFIRLGDRASAQQVLFDALKERVRGLATQGLTPLQEETTRVGRAWDEFMGSLRDSGAVDIAIAAIERLLHATAVALGDIDARIASLREQKRALQEGEATSGLVYGLDIARVAEIDRQIEALLARKKELENWPGSEGDTAAGGGEGPVVTTGKVGDSPAFIKETLAATRDLRGQEERRVELNERILRIKEALKSATGEEAEILRGRLAEAERQQGEIKGKGDTSRLEAMRQELEELKAREDGYLDYSKRQELEFWQGKLSTLRKGSADYAQVHREVYNLRRAIAKEDFDREIADLKVQMEARRKDGEERVRLAREIARRTGEAYGQESVQYKQALREVEAAQREHAEEMRQLKAMELEAVQAKEQTELELRRQNLAFQREMGGISARQEAQALQGLARQQYALELKTLQDRLQVQGLEVKERAQILHQIEALQGQHQVKMDQLRKQEVLAERTRWKNVMQPATSAMASATTSMLTRMQTWREGVASVAQAILSQFVGTIYTMVQEWAAGQLAMGTVSATRASEEVAVQSQAALAGAVAVRSAALANISAKAAEGGAAAGASVAYWPYWGWAAAPGVAAETYGMLMSFSAGLAVPSAAGGWEVPRDTLAMVHEDEMILPASISDHIRDSMGAGGQAQRKEGDTHLHLNVPALDSRGLDRVLRRNRGALCRAITAAHRDAALRSPA